MSENKKLTEKEAERLYKLLEKLDEEMMNELQSGVLMMAHYTLY